MIASTIQRRDVLLSGLREYTVSFEATGEVTIGGSESHSEPPPSVSINDWPIADAFGTSLTSSAADLIDVAVAIYVADRLCKRGHDALTWSRRMAVRVPVRQLTKWKQHSQELCKLLQFLTGDRWSLDFVQRRAELRPSESQTTIFPEVARQPATALLFSGGLDSLAGLAAAALNPKLTTILAISVITNKRIGKHQRDCLQTVRVDGARTLRHVPITISFGKRSRRAFNHEESSQRTRGFLFQALGAVTAHIGGVDHLQVPENGIGAINLPYQPWQFGTQAGRAANPIALARMSAFCTNVLECSFSVNLPNLFLTKGELLSAMCVREIASAVGSSVSCDRFPMRVKGRPQCGECTSCLLRRQSLFAANLSQYDQGDRYGSDVFVSKAHAKDGWFKLRSMDSQVARLEAALAAPLPLAALTQAFPDLVEQFEHLRAEGRESSVEAIVALYARYCEEWSSFRSASAATLAGARND